MRAPKARITDTDFGSHKGYYVNKKGNFRIGGFFVLVLDFPACPDPQEPFPDLASSRYIDFTDPGTFERSLVC